MNELPDGAGWLICRLNSRDTRYNTRVRNFDGISARKHARRTESRQRLENEARRPKNRIDTLAHTCTASVGAVGVSPRGWNRYRLRSPVAGLNLTPRRLSPFWTSQSKGQRYLIFPYSKSIALSRCDSFVLWCRFLTTRDDYCTRHRV